MIILKSLHSKYESQLFIRNYKTIILYSFLLAGLATLLTNYVWIGIGLITYLILLKVYGEKFFLFSLIISIFTLVGEVNPTLRLVVQIVAFTGLGYLFIEKYGFDLLAYPKIPSSIIKFFTLFYIAAIISILLSEHQMIGIEFILRFTAFLLLVYLFYSLIDSNEKVMLYVFSLIVAAVIVTFGSLYTIMDIILNNPSIFMIFQSRLGGFLSNVNAIAAFLFITVCLITVFLFTAIENYKKVIIIFIITLLLFGILISNSRGAILAVVTSFSIIFFYLNRKLLWGMIFTILFFIALVALIEPFRDFFSALIRIDTGLSRRDHLWNISFNMLKDHFWFGVGPGGWGKEMFNYFPVMLNSWEGKLFVELYVLSLGKNNSHNFYLAMFTDLGVLGFISSIMLPIIYMNIGYKTIRLAKSFQKEVYLLVIGITAAGAGMFVRGIFEGISIITYGWLSVDLPFWMIFGILSFYYLKLSNDRTR